MTRTAGLARIHIKHGVADPVRAGNKDFIVALGTGKRHVKVSGVAENRASRQRNLTNRMALDAIAGYRKRTFTVMATTA